MSRSANPSPAKSPAAASASPAAGASASSGASPSILDLPSDDPQELLEALASQNLGDGLPVIAPTPDRVDAMLEAASAQADATADPDEVIAVLEPRMGEATRKIIATNAVMAGCAPEHLSVLTTTVRALAQPEFNLAGVNATTHPTAPLLVVHGECVQQGGFESQTGAFGPGNRANATVGRALRLILIQVAGARPGDGDASTQGQPSKYSYCVAENAAASPWESYPRSLGITAASAVTVHAGENPHNFHDMEAQLPKPILDKAASVMATLGCNNAPIGQGEFFVGLCPEHAQTIAAAGWGRRDVQMYLFERARRTASELKLHFAQRAWRPWQEALDGIDQAPMTDSPDNIKVFVVGGAGKHSCVIPSWGMTKSVTLPVED